ncbi:SPASM domain-containing protein [Candidatus Bathyarchaeota archaeon]|nr:SPASM domain-containing protein [Candidatus Bathyarchaeota archaeon]
MKKGPLFIMPWRCTFACDSPCLHCTSANKPQAKGELNTREAIQMVDKIYDFGVSWLGITGGEPLLRRDLFEIIGYARKAGLNVSLIISGRHLNDEKFEAIVRNEVRVSVSIDGAEETNDKIRGLGAYKDAVSAIERISREKLLNCLVYTFANIGEKATNVNEGDIRHVLDLAAEYGARWVIYHSFIPYSSEKEALKADPSPQQYEWAWNTLYDLRGVYKGKPEINVYCPSFARVAKQRGLADFDSWFNNFFLGRCFFGKFMSIAENGEAIPCSYFDVKRIGNIKSKSLMEIWEEMQTSEYFAKAREKREIKGKCGVCEYKEICGGCRAAAYFYTGDILGSDPRCAYVPKALRKK